MITNNSLPAALPDGGIFLQVIVDTEEEFDWSKPFDRGKVGVGSIAAQERAQALFAPYGLRPTYVIDYPVANTTAAAASLIS